MNTQIQVLSPERILELCFLQEIRLRTRIAGFPRFHVISFHSIFGDPFILSRVTSLFRCQPYLSYESNNPFRVGRNGTKRYAHDRNDPSSSFHEHECILLCELTIGCVSSLGKALCGTNSKDNANGGRIKDLPTIVSCSTRSYYPRPHHRRT